MVKPKLYIIVDLALGTFAIMLYPASSLKLTIILFIYMAIFCFFPRKFFRFMLPLFAIYMEKLLSYFAFIIGNNLEMNYFFFIVAAIFWAVGPQIISGKKIKINLVTGTAILALTSTLLGYTLFQFFDRLIIPLGALLHLNFRVLSRQIHMAAVGILAVVLLFFCWSIFRFFLRKKGGKTIAYAYGYLGCKREYLRLGRKLKC